MCRELQAEKNSVRQASTSLIGQLVVECMRASAVLGKARVASIMPAGE